MSDAKSLWEQLVATPAEEDSPARAYIRAGGGYIAGTPTRVANDHFYQMWLDSDRMGSLPCCWNEAKGGPETDTVTFVIDPRVVGDVRALLFMDDVLVINSYGTHIEAVYQRHWDALGEWALWGAS